MQYVDIVSKAKDNDYFRKVLFTNSHTQVVLMSLKENEDIGMETHDGNDQILYFVAGEGKAIINGEEHSVNAGDLVDVPAGSEHNFINTGSQPLKLFTIYGPPDHPDGLVHETKADALADEE